MWDVLPTAVITAANTAVGEVSINPAEVRGEGGAAQPVLVMPVEVRLNVRPKEQQLAVLSLEADLAEGSQPGTGRVGTDARDLRPGMHVASAEWGTPQNRVELRFPLPRPLLERLEILRHRRDGRLPLTLSLRVVLAWVRAHNEIAQPVDTRVPFDLRYGMLADVTLFWSPGSTTDRPGGSRWDAQPRYPGLVCVPAVPTPCPHGAHKRAVWDHRRPSAANHETGGQKANSR